MMPLEKTIAALAVRPLLWNRLSSVHQNIIRARMEGQAYTAIAQTLDSPQDWTPRLVKQYELAGCNQILKAQTIAIRMDRWGMGARWRQYGSR